MSTNSFNDSVYGYTGLYRRPYSNQRIYGDTIYAITDEAHHEVHVILLSPGFYMDAFQILSSITYQDIHLYVPSLDITNISDLFGLVMDLKKIKKNVMWHYPVKYRTSNPHNVQFEMAQNDHMRFTSERITNLIISFEDAGYTVTPNLLFDIKVCNGSKGDIFSNYTTMEKVAARKTDMLYKTIHIPYNTLYYGGQTAREIVDANRAYGRFIIPNSLRCREEFHEIVCSELYPIYDRYR